MGRQVTTGQFAQTAGRLGFRGREVRELIPALVADVVREAHPVNGHGHACPTCEGRADVRQRGRPAAERVACRDCGGTGVLTLRTGQ